MAELRVMQRQPRGQDLDLESRHASIRPDSGGEVRGILQGQGRATIASTRVRMFAMTIATRNAACEAERHEGSNDAVEKRCTSNTTK